MEKPLIIPRIVWFSIGTLVLLVALTVLAYHWESKTSDGTGAMPLFDLFSDAFKVGLGAFIGVMSQWAARVFGKEAGAPNDAQ